MAVALMESSFLSNPITSTFIRPHKRIVPVKHVFISCRQTPDQDNNNDSSMKNGKSQLGRVALVAMAAGLLTLGSVDPAAAGKSGGRVGGQAFRSSAPPRSSGPRINNSRTNVYINPRVAPPLGGGYGYGGYGYGGWGWSPFSFFAPGPAVAVGGVGGGFDLFFLFIALGAASAVFRKFFGARREDDDDDY
ncbi:hypothetical protein ABFS83_10G141700 [Erythranthe nasuta]